MTVSQDWVSSAEALQREDLPDLEDEFAQLEGILPINKDIALIEWVVNITLEVVDNRPGSDNIIGFGLFLNKQLQLAYLIRENLLKQQELKDIRADIKDLRNDIQSKSAWDRSEHCRPNGEWRDRSLSSRKNNYSIKPDSLNFYYKKNHKEHQEWTQLA